MHPNVVRLTAGFLITSSKWFLPSDFAPQCITRQDLCFEQLTAAFAVPFTAEKVAGNVAHSRAQTVGEGAVDSTAETAEGTGAPCETHAPLAALIQVDFSLDL